jgi:hypothetical protein
MDTLLYYRFALMLIMLTTFVKDLIAGGSMNGVTMLTATLSIIAAIIT